MEDNIKLGNPVFDKMMFVLDKPVNEQNHRDYRFNNEELVEISDGIWAMPAYMKDDDDFSMFFIITEIDDGNTVLAFSTGEKKGEQFSLSNPIITGEALNMLVQHDKDLAASILHFLDQISKADEGNWRMVE
ncbi:hypothetical protein [Lentilactobacillus buchneri]|uniref:Uncharacterized protein n=1 Tax=Lentilactobacillus buchneri DSM 20057 TaxID=1423728 RepID=A0A4R5NJK4_LENBU|nr:hypothetical protein [Lentilactobacillus buchneri]WCJ52278.1 hypothetical protein OKF32_02740 [Lentilactobacillus sp. Egmn17]AEB74003.1 hypothetical protein Lbuc_1755 [Lentilactobacillus buchneri NRRL B-30929]MCT2882765.1 hypothetical protein [Lentilactobacillus buchneri]MCT2898980.1 hypothetical protein [Lentilactobacillus buchneri]MCT3252405.1 hypothetical protein [Lentilactobacillus buchneri]